VSVDVIDGWQVQCTLTIDEDTISYDPSSMYLEPPATLKTLSIEA
jgi:hypothetical protein